MNDAPTPRTDDVETTVKFPASAEYYELLRFTRQLERELASASQAYDCAMAIHGTVMEERDKLRADLVDANDLITSVPQIMRDRDRLKAELTDSRGAHEFAHKHWTQSANEADKLAAERDRLKAELKQVVPIEHWKENVAERDKLKAALAAMVAYAKERGCGLKIADEALKEDAQP